MKKGIFHRLQRNNAAPHDVDGIDEFSPPSVDDELYRIATEGVPMSTHGRPVTTFYGDLPNPVDPSPPRSLPTDTPPLLLETHYARARAGEGLWGVEPLIPEGETL